jgi:hypothetical protein
VAYRAARDELEVCRKNQPRAFAAGYGAGVASCGAAIGIGAAVSQ